MLKSEEWVVNFQKKRKEYGVTRSQFCSVIGWTVRQLEYMEKGERKLDEQTKKFLLDELERFNPDNPITIMFDYVRIRFPTTNAEEIIENVLKIKFRHFCHADHGFYGYTEQYFIGDIQLMFSDKTEMGVLLELKGAGCRQFESYLQAQGRDWYDFFVFAKNSEAVFKRIDVAIDDKTGLLNIPYYIVKSENRELVTLFRSFRAYKSGELKLLKEIGMGETLYLGSRSSEIHFCMYEKDYEQYEKYGIEIEDCSTKNRFEIRFRNTRAEMFLNHYLANNEIKETIFSVINRYLRFVDPTTHEDIHRMELDSKWKRFVDITDKIKLTVAPEPYDVGKSMRWLKTQVAPTFKMVQLLDRFNKTDFIEKMLEEAKFSEKQQTILNNCQTSVFSMVK